MTAAALDLRVRRLAGFDDPALAGAGWEALRGRAARSARGHVFATASWQRAWWESFGRGDLLLLLAERAGRPLALWPLFAEAGMAFPVGSGGSDYLDAIGDAGGPEVIAALLAAARDATPGFVGVRLYHLRDDSATAPLLAPAARRLGLGLVEEGELGAPFIDLAALPRGARDSHRRALRRLERVGRVDVEHESRAAIAAGWLEAFFAQHRARWAGTPTPSRFHDPLERAFYARVVAATGSREDGAEEEEAAAPLRFTRLLLDGRPVAHHLGFQLERRFLWYKPSFEPELAHLSPGTALLGALLDRALVEEAEVFDFGLGEEPFKARHATGVARVRTWGLYP